MITSRTVGEPPVTWTPLLPAGEMVKPVNVPPLRYTGPVEEMVVKVGPSTPVTVTFLLRMSTFSA